MTVHRLLFTCQTVFSTFSCASVSFHIFQYRVKKNSWDKENLVFLSLRSSKTQWWKDPDQSLIIQVQEFSVLIFYNSKMILALTRPKISSSETQTDVVQCPVSWSKRSCCVWSKVMTDNRRWNKTRVVGFHTQLHITLGFEFHLRWHSLAIEGITWQLEICHGTIQVVIMLTLIHSKRSSCEYSRLFLDCPLSPTARYKIVFTEDWLFVQDLVLR